MSSEGFDPGFDGAAPYDPFGLDERDTLELLTILTPDRLFFGVPAPLNPESKATLLQSVKRTPGIFEVRPVDGIRLARQQNLTNIQAYRAYRSITHAAIFSTLGPADVLSLAHGINKYVQTCLPEWCIHQQISEILPDKT